MPSAGRHRAPGLLDRASYGRPPRGCGGRGFAGARGPFPGERGMCLDAARAVAAVWSHRVLVDVGDGIPARPPRSTAASPSAPSSDSSARTCVSVCQKLSVQAPVHFARAMLTTLGGRRRRRRRGRRSAAARSRPPACVGSLLERPGDLLARWPDEAPIKALRLGSVGQHRPCPRRLRSVLALDMHLGRRELVPAALTILAVLRLALIPLSADRAGSPDTAGHP